MGEPADRERFIVRQFNWLSAGSGVYLRAPGERRVGSFPDLEAAVADRANREGRVRARYNPFRFGTAFHHLTTFPEPILRDWLSDGDVYPLPESGADLAGWREWWDAARDRLGFHQRDRVWDGLNRVRFYDVIARRPSQTGFAVMRVVWDYDDSFYHAGHEGGAPVVVFRTRARAEAERQRLEALVWRDDDNGRPPNWPGEHGPETPDRGFFPRDPDTFLERADPWDGADRFVAFRKGDAPQYEVVEIDLPGGAS